MTSPTEAREAARERLSKLAKNAHGNDLSDALVEVYGVVPWRQRHFSLISDIEGLLTLLEPGRGEGSSGASLPAHASDEATLPPCDLDGLNNLPPEVEKQLRMAVQRATLTYTDGSPYGVENAADDAVALVNRHIAALLTSQGETIKRLEGDLEDAQEEVAELTKAAEAVSADFEGECWIAVRSLIEKVAPGYDVGNDGNGTTAQEACDIIWQAISDAWKSSETAEAALAGVREAAIALSKAVDAFWNELPPRSDATIKAITAAQQAVARLSGSASE